MKPRRQHLLWQYLRCSVIPIFQPVTKSTVGRHSCLWAIHILIPISLTQNVAWEGRWVHVRTSVFKWNQPALVCCWRRGSLSSNEMQRTRITATEWLRVQWERFSFLPRFCFKVFAPFLDSDCFETPQHTSEPQRISGRPLVFKRCVKGRWPDSFGLCRRMKRSIEMFAIWQRFFFFFNLFGQYLFRLTENDSVLNFQGDVCWSPPFSGQIAAHAAISSLASGWKQRCTESEVM